MELVCETCGGSGFSDCLIICPNCSSYAVHRYCLGEVKLSDAEVDWHCEYCRLKSFKITSITKRHVAANEVKKNNASRTFGLTVNVKQASNATKNMVRKGKRRRRLILEDEDVDEDVVPAGSGLNVDKNERFEVQSVRNRRGLESLEADVHYADGVKKFDTNEMPGCPLSDPVWSGSFHIRGYQYGELKAHLSDIACERVSSEARSMPAVLPLRIYQRSDVWPRSFQTSPPNGENIALYFFPETAKVGDPFMELLDYIINSDLALKASFDNSELLLFPSLQLPEPYHCFEEKYYIWGIFKNRTSVESPHPSPSLGEGRASIPGKMNDSVDRRPSPSLCSPTPDTEQHDMANSVNSKPWNRSEDSITRKVFPPTLLSHHQQPGPTNCEIKKLGTYETTENGVLPVDTEACPLLAKIGLYQEDCRSRLESPEFGEAQRDTSNCLNLFPLAVEDLAVTVRLGGGGAINLELGLGRQTFLKNDGYKDKKSLDKPLECGSLLFRFHDSRDPG